MFWISRREIFFTSRLIERASFGRNFSLEDRNRRSTKRKKSECAKRITERIAKRDTLIRRRDFQNPVFQTGYQILGWGSALGCHVARSREFTIPRGRSPRRRRPLREWEISIERFAGAPRGWSWRVSANVSASGAEKLNSLPFLPRLSRSLSLPLAPSCVDSPPLAFLLSPSLSFRCWSTTMFSPSLHPRRNPVVSLWMVVLPCVFN